MPVVKHDNKRCESDQVFFSIEAERRADSRSDAVIDYWLARLEALGHKKSSWTFHLAVLAEIAGMWF